MKTCKRCLVEKELICFGKNYYRPNDETRKNICTQCMNKSRKKRTEEQLIKHRAYSRENYKKKNPLKPKKERNTPNKVKVYEKQEYKDYKERLIKYNKKYPEKVGARAKVASIKVEKGFHKHHWSYKKSDRLDFIVIHYKEHKLLHKHLVYDSELFLYRNKSTGELLETKQSHIDLITKISLIKIVL